MNEDFELKVARVVTNVLIVNGLISSVLGVVALLRWAF